MKVKELLNENTWTKGWYARDAQGNDVNYSSDNAVKWCLVGAIGKCYQDWEVKEAIFKKVVSVLGGVNYVSFNDGASWPEMHEFLEKADI